jgi:hypothetical protein
MIFVRVLVCLLIFLPVGHVCSGANKPSDRFGKPDKITIEIAPLGKPGKWAVGVMLDNDEELAAITVPLKFGERVGQFVLDSVSFGNTRVAYFALKTTNSYDTLNAVLIGLLYCLDDNRPPLEPGTGMVARLYFTQKSNPEKEAQPLVIDSTYFPPYNTLELVTPSAVPITPIFETIQVEQLTPFPVPQKKK